MLISTEAGSEGRNLQFCRHIINYDLPWNPMRVEQRIGRVHRLGQEQDVHIVNLVTEGTIDAYVLYLLDRKLDMFHKVSAKSTRSWQTSMRVWKRASARAALESDSDEDLAERIEAFGKEIERAYSAYERVKRLNAELFG